MLRGEERRVTLTMKAHPTINPCLRSMLRSSVHSSIRPISVALGSSRRDGRGGVRLNTELGGTSA